MGRSVVRAPFLVVVIALVVAVMAPIAGSDSRSPAPPAPVGGLEGVAGPLVASSSWDGDVGNLPRTEVATRRAFPARRLAPSSIKRLPTGPESAGSPTHSPSTLSGMPPIATFAGLSKSSSCTGGTCGAGWPPDTVGDVGPNNYVEAVNTAVGIFDKFGTKLKSFTFNNLFSNLPSTTPCHGANEGDPTVVYDVLADRWIVADFAFHLSGGAPVAPFYECIAASKTSDPTGSWWLYAVRTDPGGAGRPPHGTLADYPKMGLWPDGLYMGANLFREPSDAFVGTGFWAFNRQDLESGASLRRVVVFLANTTDPFTPLPANLRGATPPPGTPEYFVSESQTAFKLEVRKFTVHWSGTPTGTLSGATTVGQASYTFTNPVIVPQPNTTNKLDSLLDRLMMQAQYRRIGTQESLWAVHTVRTSTTSPTAIQWEQVNVTGGTVSKTPVQQQIFNHAHDGLYRFMPSLAVDRLGNMAVGYSTSNNAQFPSLAYAGRLVSDPLNALSQGEAQMIAGGGSQKNNCGGAPCHRWGDYTAMSVDPADDCTFWYVGQYYANQTQGTAGNWQTRIGSFKFPGCVPGTFTLNVSKSGTGGGTVTSDDGHINCGGFCSFSYNSGDTVHLTATANATSSFGSWHGCDSVVGTQCNVTVNANRTVTASFDSSDTTKPTAKLTKPSATVTFSKSIQLQWQASDTGGSGLDDVDIRVKSAKFNAGFGSFTQPASLQHLTGTTKTFTGQAGTSYCFSVRARDNAGNVSSFSAQKCTMIPVDDHTMTASAGWTRQSGLSGPFLGTLSNTSKGGATLKLSSVHAKQLGVMVKMCSGCGTFQILIGTQSLGFGNTDGSGFAVFTTAAFSSVRIGNIRIKNVTASRKIQIDGLVATQPGQIVFVPASVPERTARPVR